MSLWKWIVRKDGFSKTGIVCRSLYLINSWRYFLPHLQKLFISIFNHCVLPRPYIQVTTRRYGRNRKLFWWIFPSKSHDDSRQDLDSPVPIMHGKMLLISNTKNNEWRALNTYIFLPGRKIPRIKAQEIDWPFKFIQFTHTCLHGNLDLDICISSRRQKKVLNNAFSHFYIW